MENLLRSMGRAALLRGQIISAVFVVLFAALAVFANVDGARSQIVKSTTGIADVVTVHTKNGAYDHSTLKLLGGNVQYTYEHSAFTPALTDELLADASKVDLWYTENVLGVPRIIALQIYDGQGEHPTKYITQDYLHPDSVGKEDSIMASIFAGVAVISGITFAVLLRVGRRMRGGTDDIGEVTLVRSREGGPSASASPFGQRRRDDVPFWERQLREQQRDR
ncbi:MAG: hypothetical protein ACXVDA_08225 [Ktedonobacterales bacterium]